MNRGECRTELGSRFDTASAGGQTTMNHLLDLALSWVWDAEDWSFKRIAPTDAAAAVTLAQNDTSKALASSIGHVRDVFDHLGEKLTYFDEDTFDEMFREELVTPVAGTPDAYTLRDDGLGVKVLAFNGKLDAARTFTVSAYRKVHHKTSVSVLTAGLWNDDTDLPVWDTQYHMVIVYQAALEGLILMNDPSYDPVAALRDELLEGMRELYVPSRPEKLRFRRRA